MTLHYWNIIYYVLFIFSRYVPLRFCFLLEYALAEDKEHCEEFGRMLNANPSKVSVRAKKSGLPRVSQIAFYF